MSDHGQRLFIARAELGRAHLGPDPDAPAQRPLAPGQVRLAVEAFSLTANSITYAVFGEAMRFSSSIGGTHWSALGSAHDLPGPRPVLFFAPAQVKVRSAPPPQGWGAAELQRRLGQAWAQFIGQVNKHGWVRIVMRRGAQAALQAYGDMLGGRTEAREGLMLDMRG